MSSTFGRLVVWSQPCRRPDRTGLLNCCRLRNTDYVLDSGLLRTCNLQEISTSPFNTQGKGNLWMIARFVTHWICCLIAVFRYRHQPLQCRFECLWKRFCMADGVWGRYPKVLKHICWYAIPLRFLWFVDFLCQSCDQNLVPSAPRVARFGPLWRRHQDTPRYTEKWQIQSFPCLLSLRVARSPNWILIWFLGTRILDHLGSSWIIESSELFPTTLLLSVIDVHH